MGRKYSQTSPTPPGWGLVGFFEAEAKSVNQKKINAADLSV
jgi:hypothetical protein